jgi:hypothetical protein
MCQSLNVTPLSESTVCSKTDDPLDAGFALTVLSVPADLVRFGRRYFGGIAEQLWRTGYAASRPAGTGDPERYWMRVFLIDALGTTPRSINS